MTVCSWRTSLLQRFPTQWRQRQKLSSHLRLGIGITPAMIKARCSSKAEWARAKTADYDRHVMALRRSRTRAR